MSSIFGTLRRALLGFILLAAACLIEQPVLIGSVSAAEPSAITSVARWFYLLDVNLGDEMQFE